MRKQMLEMEGEFPPQLADDRRKGSAVDVSGAEAEVRASREREVDRLEEEFEDAVADPAGVQLEGKTVVARALGTVQQAKLGCGHPVPLLLLLAVRLSVGPLAAGHSRRRNTVRRQRRTTGPKNPAPKSQDSSPRKATRRRKKTAEHVPGPTGVRRSARLRKKAAREQPAVSIAIEDDLMDEDTDEADAEDSDEFRP